MSVSIQGLNVMRFSSIGGLKSTQERQERQQQCASQVDFFEKQKQNLKNMACTSLEDISRKLDMFHSYEDQIAAAKQQYNNSQMSHVLDEAREIGEKIAEAAEEMAPKTPEEREKERIEEATGKEDENKGMLSEIMDGISEALDEMQEELEEELLEEELAEENLPEEELLEKELTEGNLPEEEFLEKELTEGNLSEEELLEKELTEGNLPEEKLLEKELTEGNLPEEKLLEKELTEGNLPEEKLLDGELQDGAVRAANPDGDDRTLAAAVEEKIARDRMEKEIVRKQQEALEQTMIFRTADARQYPHIDYRL